MYIWAFVACFYFWFLMVFCNIFLIYYNPGLQKQVARWLFLEKYLNTFKPLSLTNDSVGSQTDAVSHVGHNSSDLVACSGRSWTDAVICNWKGLYLLERIFWIVSYKLLQDASQGILIERFFRITLFAGRNESK